MDFKLSAKSEGLLHLAHPALQRVVRRAITKTKVDFTVGETLRTETQQEKNIALGVSWTMDSKHLKQPDGYAHAVDLWALAHGEVSWAWPLYFRIAEAMQDASYDEGVPLIWGGVWDRKMTILGPDLEEASADYVLRRKLLGKKANLDGPHFQMA